jgi:hypothetical protein
MSDQPKPTGEWTAESVLKIAITETHDGAQAIADAHNAELAAGRQDLGQQIVERNYTIEQLRDQLHNPS